MLALLDAGQPGEKMLAAGVAVGHQHPGERGGDARGNIALAPQGERLQPGQPTIRGTEAFTTSTTGSSSPHDVSRRPHPSPRE